jgi:branched-chain amino acid transport system permease protein
MVTLSFAIAAAIGALAGCVASPITQTHYDSGAALAIKGFTAAILGGLGRSGGAVAAGLLLGVLEAVSVSIVPAAYKDAVAVLVLLVILSFRPSGLFGRPDEARLKEY